MIFINLFEFTVMNLKFRKIEDEDSKKRKGKEMEGRWKHILIVFLHENYVFLQKGF